MYITTTQSTVLHWLWFSRVNQNGTTMQTKITDDFGNLITVNLSQTRSSFSGEGH